MCLVVCFSAINNSGFPAPPRDERERLSSSRDGEKHAVRGAVRTVRRVRRRATRAWAVALPTSFRARRRRTPPARRPPPTNVQRETLDECDNRGTVFIRAMEKEMASTDPDKNSASTLRQMELRTHRNTGISNTSVLALNAFLNRDAD